MHSMPEFQSNINLEKELLISNELKKAITNHSLGDLIEYLCEKYTEEAGVIYLLIFISAIEVEGDITRYIRQYTNNFEWYYYPKGFNEDPYDLIINDLRILNEAFSYSIKLRSLALIEYIMNSWEKLYINPSISEVQIIPLLLDHNDENVQNILRYIVTKDIIMVNDGSLKLEEFIDKLDKSENTAEMFASSNHSKFVSLFRINHLNFFEFFWIFNLHLNI